MSLDQATNIVKHQTPTRDAFLGGRLIVSQPAHGFRAGLDSVLLGAAITSAGGALLDLGAGVGVAGLVALTHNPGLGALLIDDNEDMITLAAANIASNGLGRRAATLSLDVTAKGALRRAAGLPVDNFASVIANPPFFETARGTAPRDGARAGARHMADGALDLWVKTAAASAAPGGEVIFIHRAESLPELLAAFAARFGAITILPLSPRENEPVNRVLIRGIKGSRAPLTLLGSRYLHAGGGSGFAPAFEALFRGTGRLVW